MLPLWGIYGTGFVKYMLQVIRVNINSFKDPFFNPISLEKSGLKDSFFNSWS